jgi:cytoskeletal protein CcmA (bactofilin family)
MATLAMRGRSTDATVLTEDLEIDGSIDAAEDLSIHGAVRGPIRCEGAIDIAASGRVEGVVHAHAVRVAGTLAGDVHATERIELAAGCRVRGDLRAPRIAIAEGAVFQGRVEMSLVES